VRPEDINERNNFDLTITIYANNKVKEIDEKKTIKLNRNNEFKTEDIIFKRKIKKKITKKITKRIITKKTIKKAIKRAIRRTIIKRTMKRAMKRTLGAKLTL